MIRKQEEGAENGFKGFSLQLGKLGLGEKRRSPKESEEGTKDKKGQEAVRTKTEIQGIPTRKITSVSSVIQRAPV